MLIDGASRFIFGGHNDLTNTTFDDVYTLSLPGFRWFRASSSLGAPRALHACTPVYDRLMISVGGVRMDVQNSWGDPDPWANGIGVFDLTEMAWMPNFRAGAGAYVRGEVIDEWYIKGQVTSLLSWENTVSLTSNVLQGISKLVLARGQKPLHGIPGRSNIRSEFTYKFT